MKLWGDRGQVAPNALNTHSPLMLLNVEFSEAKPEYKSDFHL